MSLLAAPYFDDIAEGGENGAAYWMTTSDATRVRVAAWPLDTARGTLLLFPGRTEYVEKYGKTAVELAQTGYAMMAIDWRGQGLADRLLKDGRVGHVGTFLDYQQDVAALVDAAQALNMPKPWHILGHSMGGAIALRAVLNGIDVASATFTGPMWGIQMSPFVRPFAWALYFAGGWFNQGHRLAPSGTYENYVSVAEFEGNTLTNTKDMWAYMKRQLDAQPDLGLGGPSIHWVGEAMRECNALMAAPPPPVPAICFVGEDEAIVDPDRMRVRMADWPGGSYQIIPDAQHEVLMEGPETRSHVLKQMGDLFKRGEAQANLTPVR